MRGIIVSLVTAVTVAGAGSGYAQSQDTASSTVVREGDEALTCRQMADEAATLSAAMGESGGGGLLGRLGGVARVGASMALPVVGLAMAGADALAAPNRERRAAKVDAERDRWNYLNGLYAGKECGETQEPAVAPASATVPAPPVSIPNAQPRISPGTLPN